jgi:tRNA pseudouridine38-40 synthase
MLYRAIVAYDGAAYQGFQRLTRRADGNADNATVQGVLEAAIGKVGGGQAVIVIGAGRTDAGVHATGQVIAFDLDWRHDDAILIRAINATLPNEIALQTLDRAEPGFNPRHDASSRSYCYVVYEAQVRQPMLARSAWWVHPHEGALLDLTAMNKAAKLLIGEHDFATFGLAPQGENTTRVVFRSEWTVEAPEPRYAASAKRLIAYDIEATAFLYHMVRTIVGMLVEVGLRRLSVIEFEALFHAKRRAEAYRMAPPHGLTLTEVKYTGRGRRPPENSEP